jgi:hypothetical protein
MTAVWTGNSAGFAGCAAIGSRRPRCMGPAGATQETETTGSGLSKSSDRYEKVAAISKR